LFASYGFAAIPVMQVLGSAAASGAEMAAGAIISGLVNELFFEDTEMGLGVTHSNSTHALVDTQVSVQTFDASSNYIALYGFLIFSLILAAWYYCSNDRGQKLDIDLATLLQENEDDI